MFAVLEKKMHNLSISEKIDSGSRGEVAEI